MEHTKNVIKLKSATKIYRTQDMETHALRGINLNINKGEFVSISGPSGCGKSTLLSILGLLDVLSEGEYYIEGKDVSNLSLKESALVRSSKLGFIFQSFNLIDELSVQENIALPLKFRERKLSKSGTIEKVMECLELVGMTHRVNHKPNQLSGGQQQRIAIARALVCDPSILLVDEPTGNLDSKNSDTVMNFLETLNNKGTTICMVTHDSRYADFADRKLALFDGQFKH